MTMSTQSSLAELAAPGGTRFDFWSRVVANRRVRRLAEIGVWKGDFAEALFSTCPDIETYYLVDPWKHLDDWAKPANVDDDRFSEHYAGVIARTEPWAQKRVVLRGRTTEVSDQIPDDSLDFAYIDGDHSLRGISIDLVQMWPKIRAGGLIGGDDFQPSVWQHSGKFEPTVVFPLAVYFAEAVGACIEAFPRSQFAIHKTNDRFIFVDHTGKYGDLTLRTALRGRNRERAN